MSIDAVRAIFAREVAQAEADWEPSGRVHWLERLRDEVLAALGDDANAVTWEDLPAEMKCDFVADVQGRRVPCLRLKHDESAPHSINGRPYVSGRDGS